MAGKEPFELVPGKRWLRWRASGNASASGIEIAAEELVGGSIKKIHSKTLGQIFGGPARNNDSDEPTPSPLGKLGLVCQGHNPALAKGSSLRPGSPCGEQLYVLLKNASNLYFPQVKSSIFIPTLEDADLDPDIRDLTQDALVCSRLMGAAIDSEDGLVTERQARRILRELYPQFDEEMKAQALQKAANTHLLRRFLELHPATRTYVAQLRETSETGDLTEEEYQLCLDKLDWQLDPRLLMTDGESRAASVPAFGTQREQDEYEEDQFRLSEYEVFSRDTEYGSPKVDLDISVVGVEQYPTWFSDRFEKISLLKKLRETRVFTGFTRILSQGPTRLEQQGLFSEKEKLDWLPGVIVRGEGIFFEFSRRALDDWYDSNIGFLQSREALLTQAKADHLKISRESLAPISAKMVLVHTFAHVLINQLIYKCGYGSASLRERLYCSTRTDPNMNAVLIYTAAGDTEGSMGGLVRMGEPDKLSTVIEEAILRASWCSSDPICIESKGQGPSGQNLAACHACALLPETSCEQMNLMLDRSLLVGSLTEPSLGFFSDLIT